MPDSRSLDAPDPMENAQSAEGKNYLLAIGIDAYKHCRSLKNAVRDVKAFVGLMRAQYEFSEDCIFECYDAAASREGIWKAFRKLKRELRASDNLVIYYAGHGHLDEELDWGYWVPVEAVPKKEHTYIRNRVIMDFIRQMDCYHLVLISDSCFSGSFFDNRHMRDQTQAFSNAPSRWAITSGRKQKVMDGDPGLGSPFSAYLLKYLRENPSNLLLTELGNRVKVSTNAHTELYQTPRAEPLQIRGHEGGEFVFRKKLDEVGSWKKVRKEHTVEGYENYLLQFPTGSYREEAIWALAGLLGTVEAYLKYRRSYPEGKYYDEALKRIAILEEEGDWKQALRRNSIFSFEKYLETYPAGKYKAEAESRMDKLLGRGKVQPEKEPEPPKPRDYYDKKKSDEPPIDWPKWGKWGLGGLVAILFLVFGIPSLVEYLQSPVDTSTVAQDTTTQPRTLEDSLFSEKEMEPLEEEKLRIIDTETQLSEAWQDRYDKVEALYRGFHIVHLAGKLGYVDALGNELIAPRFDRAWEFGKDYTGLAKVRLGGRDFYINSQGRETTAPRPNPSLVGVQPTNTGITYKRPQAKALTREEAIAEIAHFMKQIPGGSFEMGSNDGDDDEKPVHSVRVSSFSMSRFEVTQAQWKAIMGENPSDFSNCPNCPVENVSWEDVQGFIRTLNSLSGKSYRLPKEAEWEYAARAGNAYTFAGSNSLEEVGWFDDNSGYKTHPVGTKAANSWGLYDLSGNVWEWCGDWYDLGYYANSPFSNPRGPDTGQGRVLRGGSWFGYASYSRVSNRNYYGPAGRDYSFGFRLAGDGS